MKYTVKHIPGPLPWKVCRYLKERERLAAPTLLFADRNGQFVVVENCFSQPAAVQTALYRYRGEARTIF